MDSKILLGKILQKFKDEQNSQVVNYKAFGYIKETDNAVFVTREAGEDTRLPFEKILIAIDAFKDDPELYDKGPSALRDYGITHINSPIWSILHLLPKSEYEKSPSLHIRA